ncbi:J domain-containing protein [SAR202 cluster bacterium AD-802-F09_MRT_200m]|nr:J domain-containing protein [SAR202 cluster bacterium AD-802-F09_MRT_200m]
MRDQSLYELLQVSENADQEIIQAAYRRLVLRYHPDRSSEPNAAEMTQRLNDAYAILSDPIRRARYDRERRSRASGSSSGTGQASSRTSQNRPPPPPRPPPRPPPPPRKPPPNPYQSAIYEFIYKFPGGPIFFVISLVGVIVVIVGAIVSGLDDGNNTERPSVRSVSPPVARPTRTALRPIHTIQPTKPPPTEPRPTRAPVPTFTPTPWWTPTPMPTLTPWWTPTPMPTLTPVPIPTATPVPTLTPTPVPTLTPIPTPTPLPTLSPTGSLVGTSWEFTDHLASGSESKRQWLFRSEGRARCEYDIYETPGFWMGDVWSMPCYGEDGGSWNKTGTTFKWNISNTTWVGTLRGNSMSGTASHPNGNSWTWSATRIR